MYKNASSVIFAGRDIFINSHSMLQYEIINQEIRYTLKEKLSTFIFFLFFYSHPGNRLMPYKSKTPTLERRCPVFLEYDAVEMKLQ